MIVRAWKVLLVFCLMCAGCAARAGAQATTKSSEKPSETILRMSDCVDLDDLTRGAEANLSHQLRLSRGGRIYFGTINTYDAEDQPKSSQPIIARKNGDNWTALPLKDPRLKDAAWAYVGGGPNRGEIWGILDASLQQDQADLVITHSTDGGATFSLSALHKPDALADFDSFCMGPNGSGRIMLYLFPDPDQKGSKPGFYNIRTTDGGKTWSAPEYEPDVMYPARDVPNEDQPTGAPTPPRKV